MTLKRVSWLLACQLMLIIPGHSSAAEWGITASHITLAQQPGVITLGLMVHNPSQATLSNVVLTETETRLGIKAKAGATPVSLGVLAANGDAGSPYVADQNYIAGDDITFAVTATDVAGNPVKFVLTSHAK